jgi:CheY-like chemotaxis protein
MILNTMRCNNCLPHAPARKHAMTHKLTHTPSIMVVDDTPANLRLLDDLLRQQGYRVRLFPRGALALKAAAANPPDLILLDIMMPDMDGFEVCRQLKANPALNDVPVIFISALADADHKVKAFEHGGMDYVTKPFQEAEVLAGCAPTWRCTPCNRRRPVSRLSWKNWWTSAPPICCAPSGWPTSAAGSWTVRTQD